VFCFHAEFQFGLDTSRVMCRTKHIFAFWFAVFFSHQFAGEKCVLPQYHIDRQEAGNGPANGSMRPADLAGGNRNAPMALGFKCAHCDGEFGSRKAMNCHRRLPRSIGTGCEDPKSSKSMSYTGRANLSSSIVRQHDTLGATHTLTLHSHTRTLHCNEHIAL
jgi:hypothetical protein